MRRVFPKRVSLVAICVFLPLLAAQLCNGDETQDLVAQMMNGSVAERVEAIQRVASLDSEQLTPDDRLIDALTKSLKAADVEIRDASSRAIKKLGPVAINAAPTLISELNPGSYTLDGNPLWNLHSETLASLGPKVVPQLLDALETENEARFQGVCAAIHNMFADLDDDSAKIVAKEMGERLESETGIRRWCAAYAIVEAGERGESLVPQLISALEDDDFRPVMTACQALANIGPAAKPAVRKLMLLSKEGVTSVRGHSALALAAIGPVDGIEFDGVDIVGRLREMLEDPNATVAERALIALGHVGPAAAEALQDVSAKMMDKRFRARSEAAYALWLISSETNPALEQLIELIELPGYEIDGIQKIGAFGTDAKAAIPTLVNKFEAGDTSVRIEVCDAVASIGINNEAVRQMLEVAKESTDEDVRTAALAAIAKLRGN